MHRLRSQGTQISYIADAEGFNDHRRQHRSSRLGEGVKVRRSPQAVACKKRCVVEPRKPRRIPDVGMV